MLNKRCPKCKHEYVAPDEPPEGHFYRNAANASGLSTWCRKCIRASIRIDSLSTKRSIAIKKGLLPPTNIDHECRRRSFYYDDDAGMYRCPLCHTPYSATYPIGPPPEGPKKKLALVLRMEIWRGNHPKKPSTSCMIVDGEIVPVWRPEIKT